MEYKKFSRWVRGKGLRNHPLFKRYHAMRSRCRAKGTKLTKFWGDKGIKVCKRWMLFENFLKDMEPSFYEHIAKHGARQTTIERINSSRGYSPKNCKWATRFEQNSNTSRSVIVEYSGEKLTMSEWARKLKADRATIYYRVFIAKWPLEKALTRIGRLS